ncbi:hypothetical protein GZ77_24265 [Endozoicomonas montiporae]|uniref:CN hydrolase domain-containing protein n=2 Tax=Endozoicomonas montiporae TaxID=1027273 RepID=A0A081MZL6_9GAMM|nr:nitrilase-related carbon-nitrogen hydrolase [Endozoicomonas montiporae]AMO54676.1 putative amidohydrolase [Endozoicomonas montiporae CL-33]KEQ11639.1 hypothetical protein GZ77_24265 [Endozoicomonas montiporae]
MTALTIASVQFKRHANDKFFNLTTIRSFAGQASKQNVDILIFPELCIPGFLGESDLSQVQADRLAESFPDGLSCLYLQHQAELFDLNIGAGMVEADNGLYFNTFVMAMRDGRLERHRKSCLFGEHSGPCNDHGVFKLPDGLITGILSDSESREGVHINAMAENGARLILTSHPKGSVRVLDDKGQLLAETAGTMDTLDVVTVDI